VGVHEAITTGSVEVVMDEENSWVVQACKELCGNFRRKLCALGCTCKRSRRNSKDLVDKRSQRAGRAAVDKILASIDGDAEGDQERTRYTEQRAGTVKLIRRKRNSSEAEDC
jgi:hypothetical protein